MEIDKDKLFKNHRIKCPFCGYEHYYHLGENILRACIRCDRTFKVEKLSDGKYAGIDAGFELDLE